MSNIADLLQVKLQGKDGETNGSLEGVELLGLYFSAHWCPPCRGFTPNLTACYNAVNAGKKRWEIVFVSMDHGQKEFDSYYAEMPWLAVSFDDDSRESLAAKHSVKGIPALVLINPKDGKVVNGDGRGCVQKDLQGANFPWTS